MNIGSKLLQAKAEKIFKINKTYLKKKNHKYMYYPLKFVYHNFTP